MLSREAHPDAFVRMVFLMLDHDLIRFSAAVRAIDGWFGFAREVDGTRERRGDIDFVVVTGVPLAAADGEHEASAGSAQACVQPEISSGPAAPSLLSWYVGGIET